MDSVTGSRTAAETTKYKQTFYPDEAYLEHPEGCTCPDRSGACPWCKVYYDGPPEPADKLAAGTVEWQQQNVTETEGGGGKETTVSPAQQPDPRPHSPNAPATAPRSPGIRPRVVGPIQEDDDMKDMTASKTAKEIVRCECCGDEHDIDEMDENGLCPPCSSELELEAEQEFYDECPRCGKRDTERIDAEGRVSLYCGDCDQITYTFDESVKPGEPEAPEFKDFPEGHVPETSEEDKLRLKGLGVIGGKKTAAPAAVAPAAPAAPAAPPNPNVVQQQNIVRPAPVAGPGGTMVAISPGGSGEEGRPERKTIEPELPNAKYHMSAEEELLHEEETRLAGERTHAVKDWAAWEKALRRKRGGFMAVKTAGGTTFMTAGTGKTIQEAFGNAVSEAAHESGHGGYSGTIAEKSDFVLLTPPKGIKPDRYAQWVMSGPATPSPATRSRS